MRPTNHKKTTQALVWFLLILLFVGCVRELPNRSTPTVQPQPDPTLAPSETFTPTQTTRPTATITHTPTPKFTSTATINPTTLIQTLIVTKPVSEWSTYLHPTGVEIKYPSGWTVETLAEDTVTIGGIYLRINPRALKDRSTTDPHTWEPNEGGMAILWEKPVDVNGIRGIEFLWGPDNALTDGDARGAILNAILYNAERELDVRLDMGAQQSLLDPFSPDRFDINLDSNMIMFDQMFKSIRFRDPIK